MIYSMAAGHFILLLAMVSLHVATASGISEPSRVQTRQPTLTDTSIDAIIERIKKSTDQVLKQKLERTKEIYKLDETPTHHRARRSIPDQLTEAYDVFYELNSIRTLNLFGIPNCIDIEFFSVNNVRYIIASQYLVGFPPVTTLYEYNPVVQNASELQQIYETSSVKDLVVFQVHVGGKTMLINMESNLGTAGLPTSTVLYEFNSNTMQFDYIQRIYTNNPTKVEVFNLNGQQYAILVGAFVETVSGGIQRTVSALYKWKGGHLDKISTFITGDALDVHPFQIHNHVFLALADHTDSYILRFNPHLEVFFRYQDIEITEAIDWEYFYLGDEAGEQDHFLAVARGKDGPSTSVIYKYHRNEFVPFQSFPTTGARSWHAVKESDGTLRILALASDDGIDFFQYNGWRFEKSVHRIPPRPSERSDSQSMDSFISGNEMFLAVADNTTVAENIYELIFTKNMPVLQLHGQAASTCLHIRAENTRLQSRLNDLIAASRDLVYVNSSDVQVITGNKTFQQNVTMDTVVVKKIDANNSMILDAEEKVDFLEVRSNQSSSLADLISIERELAGVLRKTGTEQTIRGQKTMARMTVSTVQADTANVEGDVINRHVNLSELVTDTWHKDTDQSVDIPFSIAGNVTVLGNLTISETLDGIHTSQIVTLSRNHTVEGNKTFQRPVHFKGNLDVLQSIDGVSVTETDLLLTYGNQTIQTHMNVSGVVTFSNNVEVDGLVDGCGLSTISQDAVLTFGDFNVTGNKTLTGDLTPLQGISLVPGHTIDGVDIMLLNTTAMKTLGNQALTGNYTFTKDVDMLSSLTVSGHVDGLSIPSDILIENSNIEAVLAGIWVISDNVTMATLTVETSIDGILATGLGTGLELLLNNGSNQTVEGNITFTWGLGLEGSSEVIGLVDGVHIPSMVANVVYKNGSQEITAEKRILTSVDFQQNLLVGGLVNEINITSYDASALKLFGGDDVLVLNGDVELTAAETKMAGPLITKGNHSFPYKRNIHDLVIQGIEDTIYGFKSFSEVSSDEDIQATTVNGINISHYFNESIRIIPGVVLVLDGNVTFWDDVAMNKNLKIQSQIIDDVYIPDIVTLINASSVVSMTTFTSDVRAWNMYLHTLVLSGLLNEYDVQTVDRNTLKSNINETQYVTGNKTFLNGLSINGDLVVTGNTNGADLSAVAADAVYINHVYTIITAEKVFDGLVDITHLDARDHVDGVHLPSFSEQVVRQIIPQTIESAIWFNQDVHFNNNVTVVKTINGYNVSADLLRVLSVLDSSYYGELRFSDVVSGDNVTVDDLIDGFRMNEFVLTQSDFQIISGEKRFFGLLKSQASMIALLINGISIDDLNAVAVRHNEVENISGNKTFSRGISLQQNLTVTTLVDTVDVQELEGNSLMLRSDGREEQILHGNGSLGDVIIHGNITYNGTLDGVDLGQLGETYMSLTFPQTVTGNKTFQDKVTVAAPGFLDATSIQLVGDLNGVNLEMFAESVWVDGRGDTVKGIMTFTQNATLDSLNITGTINGLDIAGNAMITNQDNIVTGFKRFTGRLLIINETINMADLMEVDGVDLSEFNQSAVTIMGNFIITQPTTFAGIILQNNLVVDGELDGVNISTDVLLLTVGTQDITGNKTFSQDISVAPNIIINGLLNGVDLVDLFQNTLLISPNQTIFGNYTFLTELILGNATTMAKVDGLRIPELYRLVYTYPSFTEFNHSLRQRCDMLSRMHEAQFYAAVLLAHLEISQVIDTVGYFSWHSFYYNDTQWLVAAQRTAYPSTACIASDIYHWNETTGDYVYYQSLYPKSTVDVDSFVVGDRLFLVLAGKHNDLGQCSNFPSLNEGDDVDGIITHNRTSIPSNFYSYSTTNVLVWLPTQETFYLYQALPCVSPSDIEVFVDLLSNQTCLAIANEIYIDTNADFHTVLPSYVYCLESLDNGFYLKDTFITSGASKIRHFFRDGILHLAVANRLDDITHSFTAESGIFQQTSNGTFTQLVTVEGYAACDILPVTIEGNLYIVLGNEFTGTLNNPDYDTPVEVYRLLDTNTLFLEQDLKVFGTRSLGSYNMVDQFYLIIVDRLATTLYKFKGTDLFVKVHTLTTYGATSLHVFPLGDTGRMQVAVASYDEQDLLIESQSIHALPAPSLILDFVLIGERIPSVDCDD